MGDARKIHYMTAKITLLREDITQLKVDVIVNAANSTLLGGGGVDGAIHRSAGPELLEACKLLNGCDTGEAKITPGFQLAAKWVVHAVGPVWQGGGHHEAESLISCYQKSLLLAEENGARSVAFPAISCGVYGYPIEQACNIAVNTVSESVLTLNNVRKVIFCAFDERVYSSLLDALSNSKLH